MTRISDDDMYCCEIRWFALDKNGYVYCCLTAGNPNIPEFACRNEDEQFFLDRFFLFNFDKEKNSPTYHATLSDQFIEKLKLDELNFRSVDAKNVPLKDAIENDLVSIEDWRKYASKIRKEGDTEILQNENYEIAITNNECVIRPITK